MAEYGRRRSPAKRVYWETGIEGSNPSLSVNTKGQLSILSFFIYKGFEDSERRRIERKSIQDVCDSELAGLPK